MKRIAIIGGGIAGVTAAWQLARLAESGIAIEATLFEASPRLGGIVETVRIDGFTIEGGPDAWVTEKPWARDLAVELSLADQIIPSNDATRKTYILQHGKLVPMPDGMRMMVPSSLAALEALDASPLFSPSAKAAFRAEPARAAELKSLAPAHDESVATFVQRHFGLEVLEKIGAPLLSGVFGGDVTKLSVRAVMAPFVQMEREHGSLILALEQRANSGPKPAVFTTLRTGTGTLIEAMVAAIPPTSIHLKTPIHAIARTSQGWSVEDAAHTETFDELLLAVPPDVACKLLAPTDAEAAAIMHLEASSAVVAAFAFATPAFNLDIDLPPGFGFLVPPGPPDDRLLAATFVDQKFPNRAPAGGRLIRAFFGGLTADRLLSATDEAIANVAITELRKILGPLPTPHLKIIRRWPRALPQYAVGHLDRMAALFTRIDQLGNLALLGNGYQGVGLPDLIRDSRNAARNAGHVI